MGSREGRGRPRRDYPVRSDGQSQHGRELNPPSRHLWVGNISHNLTEGDLAHYFLQFGELESIAFQPGRSYAFLNYKNQEDAFDAVKELQGFVVGGNPLRIEFAKAEKSLIPPDSADYPNWKNDPRSMARDSPFNQRDSRAHHSSPAATYINKPKASGNDSEPSEILWIGFPAQLKVDEFTLRKAFSPFGEIEKITAFPGRTYAFVRFRNVRAACRAKETLHGKLFGNPRVHICFSKNDSGGSNKERSSMNARPGSPERYPSDRNFGGMSENHRRNRSPPFIPNRDTDDRDVMGLTGMSNFRPSGNDYHEQRRFPGQGSDVRFPGNIYEHPVSPLRDRGAHFREFSSQKYSQQGPYYDDPWDLPEDVSFLRENEKLKSTPFPPDNDLPEYPLSDLGKLKHVFPHEIPQSGAFNRNFDSRTSGNGLIPDHLMNAKQPFGERGDNWDSRNDNFQVGSSSLPPRDRANESSSKVVWKWEGMIAKVGTPVCRARCFPVGKSMEMALPNCIDCTAKTSLDMLAKHYYQATSAWVVFFVPANDPDMAYYNEFMNYLGDKQRAAVAKLDELTTLFLVPPSEFSEKVLKVPGKLSISGVVLRSDPHGPNTAHGQLYKSNKEIAFTSFQSDASQPYLPTPIFTQYEKPRISVAPNPGDLSFGAIPARVLDERGHDDYVQKPPGGTIWSNHDPQNSNFNKNFTSQPLNSAITYSSIPERVQEKPHNSYASADMPGVTMSGNGNPGIKAEQLAQLASSLLGGQHSQFSGEYVPQSGNMSRSGYSSIASQNYGLPANGQMPSGFGPVQSAPQREVQVQGVGQVNQQQQQENVGQEEEEADPEKRLRATLELAASLLKQIQQGKGNSAG